MSIYLFNKIHKKNHFIGLGCQRIDIESPKLILKIHSNILINLEILSFFKLH